MMRLRLFTYAVLAATSLVGSLVVAGPVSAHLGSGAGTRAIPTGAARVPSLPLSVSSELARTSTPVSESVRNSILHCWHTTPDVWLTFDDGGRQAQVYRILDVLEQYNVRAVFLPTGQWAAGYPVTMGRIRGEGHWFGNHTYSHPDLTKLSSSVVLSEIRRGVQGTTDPKVMRPPYGAGAFEQRTSVLAAMEGHKVCFWTVDTRDWDGSSASTIIRRVRVGDSTTPPARSGGVVLMHMHGRYTGDALPGVITAIRGNGLTLPRLR